MVKLQHLQPRILWILNKQIMIGRSDIYLTVCVMDIFLDIDFVNVFSVKFPMQKQGLNKNLILIFIFSHRI